MPADLETGLFQTLGFSPNDIYLSPELSAVAAGSGADVAGIMPGDIIVAIDERVVDYWSDVSDSVRDRPGETVEVLLFREQQALTVTATLGDVRTGGRRIGALRRVAERAHVFADCQPKNRADGRDNGA